MFEVLFSSLQFKFAQCHTWVMKKKNAKHKKMLNRFLHSIKSLARIQHLVQDIGCKLFWSKFENFKVLVQH